MKRKHIMGGNIHYRRYRMPTSYVIDTSKSSNAKLVPLPVKAVKFAPGGFWNSYFEGNREISIPKLFELFEEKGVLDNFRRLTGKKQCERLGPVFTDSDIFKWMEGAAFALANEDDPVIHRQLETAITDILPAQCEDGYLNTYFTDPATRFTDFNAHEMYCAGHYFQAAVAIYRCLNDDRVLKSAVRYADYLYNRFGPGKKEKWVCGHPEIEMSLVELSRTTGDKKYLEFARHILDQLNADAGWVTCAERNYVVKFTDRKELFGHAVRNLYMSCAGSDIWAETGDKAFGEAVKTLWNNFVNCKIYITGGVGSRYIGEIIGLNYELPNLLSYTETCAAIAAVMWNYRNLQITGETAFADWMERSLYNGVISGISLDYQKYFYVNPLSSLGYHERRRWFDCTCCPSNIQRLLAALPGYLYSTDAEGVWVHLYDSNSAEVSLKNGSTFKLIQQTQYPYDGKVTIRVESAKSESFTMHLRIPGWASGYEVRINGKAGETSVKPGQYLSIKREWRSGDEVELMLPMAVKFIACHPMVENNYRQVAIMRGPLVYCLEDVDNSDLKSVHLAALKNDFTALSAKAGTIPAKGFQQAITAIELPGEEIQAGETLYSAVEKYETKVRPTKLTAIPYYAWANRGRSQMRTWIPIV